MDYITICFQIKMTDIEMTYIEIKMTDIDINNSFGRSRKRKCEPWISSLPHKIRLNGNIGISSSPYKIRLYEDTGIQEGTKGDENINNVILLSEKEKTQANGLYKFVLWREALRTTFQSA